ncbi:MAG: PAS domain S-box protein [Bacteroidota bacterium]
MKNSQKKILAIDDNPDNLVVIKALLTDVFPDIPLLTATSGKEGMNLIRAEQPDVILLDIIMPDMNGYEVCSLVKGDAVLSRIPIIMLTAGKSDSESRIRALDAGADAFVTKPVESSELTAQVRSMLRIKEAEDNKASEKMNLEKLVQARTTALEYELKKQKEIENELQATFRKLEQSSLAEMNLLEDLRQEIEIRKKAEEVLKEREEKYRLMVDHSPDAVIVHSGGTILFANDAALKFSGLQSIEMLIGSPVMDFVHPDSRPSVVNRISKMMKTGKPAEFLEEKFISVNKEVINVEVIGIPIQFEGKKAIQTIARDITERKLSQSALVANEERFRHISSSISNISYSCTSEREGIYSINWIYGATEKITGLTQVEFKALNCWGNIVMEEDFPLFKKNILDLTTGRSSNCELRIIHKDGSIVWIESSATCVDKEIDSGKSVKYVYGGLVDISERKRAEKSISEALEFNKFLLQTIPYPMEIVDESGNVLFLRDNLLEQFGADALGKKCWELYRDDKKQCDHCPLTSGIHIGETSAIITENVMNGKIFEINHTGMMFQGKKAMLEIFRDITEQTKREDEIRQLNTSLDQKVKDRTLQLELALKELESFSYSVSHDLRAPLRGIDGWSLALLEDYEGKLDRQADLYLKRVRMEAQKMGLLIDDLLQLSRITRSEINIVTLNLSKIAISIVDKLKKENPGREVKCMIKHGVIVKGDPILLEIVLINLLNNAWKFTGRREDAEIEFGTLQETDETVYFIRDNGAGFDMKYVKKLFGAFQRLHTENEFPGTGVGLATVQRIIHRHDGRIWAESVSDQGTTFYFTLNQQ